MSDPRVSIGTWDVVAGDPLTVTVNITANGSGVDLTAYGSSWAADLRQGTSQTPPVTFTIDATNAATGTLILSLTGDQTAAMATDPGNSTAWHFDLQASGGSPSPQTPFRGDVTAWRPFTHA